MCVCLKKERKKERKVFCGEPEDFSIDSLLCSSDNDKASKDGRFCDNWIQPIRFDKQFSPVILLSISFNLLSDLFPFLLFLSAIMLDSIFLYFLFIIFF